MGQDEKWYGEWLHSIPTNDDDSRTIIHHLQVTVQTVAADSHGRHASAPEAGVHAP